MTFMSDSQSAPSGLPDPDTQPDFYADTVTKRLLAWVVDVLMIGLIVALTIPLTLFVSAFFLPAVWMIVAFVYRAWSLASHSATPGMRVMSLEIRGASGRPLDAGEALLHTGGYFVSMAIFPLQLVSIVLMLMTPRKQGLTDHLLGTAAINRAAMT